MTTPTMGTKTRKVGSLAALAVMVLAVPSAAADPYAAEYKKATAKHVGEIVAKGNKVVTHDEHVAINEHWHLAMRALRVREVAQEKSDTATVGRVDTLLASKDASFFKHLEELNAKAPVKTVLVAPKVTSPSEGQSMPLDAKLAFHMDPYKNASKYYCALVEGKHTWVGVSKTPECDLDVANPRHAKFAAGAAEFRSRALVKGVWSEAAKVNVTLAGTAPPAPTVEPNKPSAPPPPPPPEGASKWDTAYKNGYFWDEDPINKGKSGICPAIGKLLSVSGGKASIAWVIQNPSISQHGPQRKGRDNSNEVGAPTIELGTFSFAIPPSGQVNETVSLKPLAADVLAAIVDEKNRAAWSNLSVVKITGEFSVAKNTAPGGVGAGRMGTLSISVPGLATTFSSSAPSCSEIRMVEEHFVRADCRSRGYGCASSNECCGESQCFAGICIARD